jgi:hypothetical protein
MRSKGHTVIKRRLPTHSNQQSNLTNNETR